MHELCLQARSPVFQLVLHPCTACNIKKLGMGGRLRMRVHSDQVLYNTFVCMHINLYTKYKELI